MKFKDIKFDGTKVLPFVVTTMGIVGGLLSMVVDKNNRNTMKDELRKEILDEITKSK